MKWLAVLFLLSGCTGILKMGLSVKVDIFGAKAQFKLPLEFYPLGPDGGWPPEKLVCE